MNDSPLLIANDGAVRRITVNRPDKLNALNAATLDALHDAFRDAAADDSVHVVVLTGAGPKAFVAGADIAEMNTLTPVQGRDFALRGQRMMRFVEKMPKPVIAMVNGFALGGGLELAMACHLRIAAETAKVGQPEINLGLIPGFGGSQRLLRLAGRAATLELDWDMRQKSRFAAIDSTGDMPKSSSTGTYSEARARPKISAICVSSVQPVNEILAAPAAKACKRANSLPPEHTTNRSCGIRKKACTSTSTRFRGSSRAVDTK